MEDNGVLKVESKRKNMEADQQNAQVFIKFGDEIKGVKNWGWSFLAMDPSFFLLKSRSKLICLYSHPKCMKHSST